MNEEEVKRSVLLISEEDKKFFIGNEKLEKYLTFKYEELIKGQEDLMKLVKKELEEILKTTKR